MTRTAVVVLTLAILTPTAQATAQASFTSNPDSAHLVASDIPRFWAVFDHALFKGAGAAFQRDYVDAGSAGVEDFIPDRIVSGEELAKLVATRIHYYEAIRSNTLMIANDRAIRDSIRTSFRRLKALYPAAVFPDVYFVIGRMNSGGTSSSRGLIIGAEMNARDDSTPTGELDAWAKAVTGQLADLPHVVAHELIHFQQAPTQQRTLLAQAMREGSADYVAELISGKHANAAVARYGEAHEAALWDEFKGAMLGTVAKRWLYQGAGSVDRPADLGYWMGYKICAAYYARAADKSAALAAIIRMDDPAKILAESGYNGGR
jgi:predicted Zn-dependent protease DUF2268